ncbi:MAG: histidinol-phosphatase HisJ family protein [Pleomorphochaeta sp.]
MILTNLHTHTTFSDGKNTIEEVVNKAIKLNFESIGISDHAECGYDIGCPELMLNNQISYYNIIDDLNNKYQNINIYKGLELDSLNWEYKGKPDYTIGSVHNFLINNKVYTLDWKIEYLKELLDICHGERNFIIKYYQELINFAKASNYDITGHLDLYTKFNEKEKLFNIEEKWYLETIKDVINELNKLDKIIEINTGAIGRGYRTTPYPDIPIIKILKELNSKVIVGSDSHSIETLNCYFYEIENILKSIGIKEIYKFSKKEFIPIKL